MFRGNDRRLSRSGYYDLLLRLYHVYSIQEVSVSPPEGTGLKACLVLPQGIHFPLTSMQTCTAFHLSLGAMHTPHKKTEGQKEAHPEWQWRLASRGERLHGSFVKPSLISIQGSP